LRYYSKSRRVCKAGCGKEKTENQADTPGFPLDPNPKIETDYRGCTKLSTPRNNARLNQTSIDMLQSWRANCNVQLLIYNCDPEQPSVNDIARVTDYVVGYACKGNTSSTEETQQIRHMIMA